MISNMSMTSQLTSDVQAAFIFSLFCRQRRMADKKHGMPVNETNYNESWRLNENDVINTRNACDQVATRA